MKKLVVLGLVLAVSACSNVPKNPYDRAVYFKDKRAAELAEQAIENAPEWMTNLPIAENAVYATGSAVSRDFGMADTKAKTIAYSKICMAAGGQVDQQSKVFLNDTELGGTEMSTTAIRSFCKGVDVTGAQVDRIARTAEGPNIRTYVLVALPTGTANQLKRDKENLQLRREARQDADQAFVELDSTVSAD